jgi:1-acyl-sn-glycerol-3-phosphate acyltransferase
VAIPRLPAPPHRVDTFTATERLIRAIAHGVNHRPLLKQWSHAFLRTVGASWVHLCSRNIVRVTNAGVLDQLDPARPLVISSNHRSYVDMYLLSSVLLRRCGWIERMYFPVRDAYFYERVGGLLINVALSGLAMYPPIYRQPGRRPLNRQTVAFIADELRRSGTVVGLHPEGRRSTTADPYTLLPAQPGLGDIVHRARPVVLPAFIAGVPGDLRDVLRANFGRRPAATTITITFGAPVALDELLQAPAGPRTSLRIAQAIRAEIERLGAIDREWRESGGAARVRQAPAID